jgi:TP901 family phage tail tape measure protein
VSDVNANIGININAAPALAELKNLQRQLANFHSQVAKGSAASAAAQKGLQTNLLNAINATGKFQAQMGLVRTSTESFTHALENNKLSMGQYFRYAGGATKTFGRLFKSEFDTIGKVAEERVKKMQTQYIKMGRDANGATKAMAVTPLSLNMKDAATQTALAAQKQAVFNQLIRQGSTNLLNFGKNTQWAGRQLMVGFSVPLAYFGSMAAKTFMDLEAQAVRFKRVYGDMFTTTEQTNKALSDIQNIAKEFTKYGVAVVDTMKMAADAAAMGKTGSELAAQVSSATKLAVLGGVDQATALQTTISLTNAFGISAQDLTKNIDFLNAVENQTVLSIEDLTVAIPKAAPVVKQLGGNVQDLAFFLTAMKEGGINASEGANALKSGLAAMINPTKSATTMLSSLGINIKAIVEGDKGNLKKTVLDFATALNTLDPLARAQAIEKMFGKFQFARISTLFQNITKGGGQAGRVLDLTTKSVEELAIISERELKVVQDAVGVKFKASMQELKLAIAPIGKIFLQAVTPILKVVTNLFEKFNNLSDGTKKFIAVGTILVGVVGPVLLMTFGLLANGLANIVKLFLALRVGFLKMTGDSKNLGATTNYLTAQQLEAETVAASLNQAHTKLTQQFEMEATAVNALRAAYVEATIAAGRFAIENPGMMSGKFVPKKFATGTSKVPGYASGTDTVPAMLTPGEAVIPAKVAQNPKNKPFIQALIDGSVKKYSIGTANAGEQYSHVGKSKYVSIDKLLTQVGISELDKQKLTVYKDILKANGLSEQISTRHSLAYSFAGEDNRRMAGRGLPLEEWQQKWMKGGAKKWISSNIPASQAQIVDDAILQRVSAMKVATVNDDIIEKAFNELPAEIQKTPTYQKMKNLYSKVGEYTIGKGLGDTPTTTKAVLEQAKAQGLIKDYEIRERLSQSKGKVVNSGITITTKDGTRVELGRGSAGQRNPIKDTQSIRRGDKTVAVGLGETVVDPTTGKITKTTLDNTVPKPSNIKSSTGSARDSRLIRIPRRAFIVPGAATGIDENGNPLGVTGGVKNIPFSNAAEQTRISQNTIKQAQAIEESTKTTVEATKTTKTMNEKINGASGAFAGLTILGSFLGGQIGDVAKKLVPFAIGIQVISQLMPALKGGFTKLLLAIEANPYVAAAVAIAGLALMWKHLDDKARAMAEAQSNYIDQISATTEKMKQVGQLTGKVGASELMARRREGGTANTYTTGYDRAGQQFGTNFLSSDVGKAIYNTFKTNVAKGGGDAVKQVALELSAYVSDGLMTAEDANSVARSIGINMSDMTIAANIRGKLREVLGPDGQDLATNPLLVRVKIIKEQTNTFADIQKAYQNTPLDTSTKQSKELAASLAASGTQSLELIQAQRDAQAKLYDDQIRGLQTQLAATTDKKKQVEIEQQIKDLKTKQASDDSKIAAQRKKAIDDQLKAFGGIRGRERGTFDRPDQAAYFASLNQQVKNKYKNDPLASVFLDTAKKTKSLDLEIAIKTIVGAGDLAPNTATKLINMFGKEKEAQLTTLLTTTFATQDPGKVAELINLATNMNGKGGKEIGLKLLTEIGAKGQEAKFDDRLSALTLLQQMDGKEINLGVFLQGDAVAKLDSLVPMLNKVEALKGPITKKVLTEFSTNNPNMDLKGLISNWEYYQYLDPEIQKTAIQTFISVYKTIGEKEKSLFAQNKAGGATSGTIFDYWMNQSNSVIAEAMTQQQFKPGTPPSTPPKGGQQGSGALNNRDTTLDNILNRLKMVRDASINAVGGITELNRITSGAGITKFSGLINQLMSGAGGSTGQNRGFISFIESMDDATRKTYINTEKLKKGIVELTPVGKNLAKAFNEQTLGDFNTTQLDTITQTKAQQTAFIKLKAAGVDSATALDMVANAELAIAINSSVEPANKLKDMANAAKTAKDAVDNLNLAFKQTMQTSVSELGMLKQLPGLVDQMNALGLSVDQIQAVLNNPDFAKEMLNNLKDGKIISQDLVDYLASIPAKKQIELDIAMKTPQGMQGLFDTAMGNAQEYFNTLEAAIQLKFKQPMKDAQKAVDNAKVALDAVQTSINGLQSSIDTKQRNIEINITRVIETYQAQIDSIQAQITAQFDKPIAVLGTESNKLSHDLSLMDHAAQAINDKYDAQAKALTQIADINSQIAAQQKQQLTLADALTQGDISAAAAAAQDMRATQAANQNNTQQSTLQAARDLELANLTNSAGMTKTQIEERQYQIGEQTYALEQQRQVLQDQIATIQETKIAPLEAQKVIAEREIRDLEDQIYGIQQGALKTAQDNLDTKQKALDALQTELTTELDTIDAQRDRWVQAQNAIDLAKVKSDAFGKSMEYSEGLVSKLVAAWNSLSSKTITLTTNTINTGSSGTTQTTPTTTTKTTTTPTGTVNTTTLAGIAKASAMSTGGFVTGTGAGDSVPTMLTPGEFVMNKAASKAFGPILSSLNGSAYPSSLGKASSSTYPTMGNNISSTLISQSYPSMSSSSFTPINTTSVNAANDNSTAVYNYSVGINVGGSNSSPDEIARAVMTQIKFIDSQRIRNQRA